MLPIITELDTFFLENAKAGNITMVSVIFSFQVFINDTKIGNSYKYSKYC